MPIEHINWLTVLVSILGGAGTSTILSGVFNWRFKKIDYQYDYSRYILEKRKKAYDYIELLIGEASKGGIFRYRESIDGKALKIIRPRILQGTLEEMNNNLSQFLYRHAYINNIEIWCSDKLITKLNVFNKFLREVDENLKVIDELTPGTLFQICVEYHKHKKNIILQFLVDMKELDNLKKFKRNKIKSLPVETYTGSEI